MDTELERLRLLPKLLRTMDKCMTNGCVLEKPCDRCVDLLVDACFLAEALIEPNPCGYAKTVLAKLSNKDPNPL